MPRIYIPTRGRAGMQKTLSGLPKKLAADAVLVVDKKDAKAYEVAHPDNELMVLPPRMKGIAFIRQYIMEYAEEDYICMLDDDLYFGAKKPDGRILKTTQKENMKGFQLLDKWLKGKILHCSLIPRFLWWNQPYEIAYRENTRMMHVLAYNRPAVLETGCSFIKGVTSKFSMDDFHMTLQLIAKGHKNRVSLRYCTSPSQSNSKGGASEWRTLESHNYSAKQLHKIHGDCVKVKEKHGWEGMEGTRLDVDINWRKAAEQAGLPYDPKAGLSKR